MSASFIDLLTILAAAVLPTVIVTRFVGPWLARSGQLMAVAVCGLAVPVAVALFALSQTYRGGGVGYGDAMGLAAILIFAALAAPITLLTSFLMLWWSRDRRS